MTSTPRRRLKWALGVVVGFGLTVIFLLAHPNDGKIKSIFTDRIQNVQDIQDVPSLCQPSATALSNNSYTCLGTRPKRLPLIPSSPPVLPHVPLPQYCLDAHFATGVPCSGKGVGEIDIVWIWANGSDPVFQEAISDAEDTSIGLDTTTSKVGLGKGAKLYRYARLLPTGHCPI